jgi:hypothetical protein
MLQTRDEIAALLKQAEGNLQKTQAIHRELAALMVYIQSVLEELQPSQNGTKAQKRKPPK